MFGFRKEKKSKRQLERHLERGKELITKVSKRLSDTIAERDSLREQLKSAYTYMALLVFENGITVDIAKAYEVNLQKSDLEWAMKNLKIKPSRADNFFIKQNNYYRHRFFRL